MTNEKINLIIVFIGLIILSGCKIKYSFSGASISPEIKTVSVQYFVNRAPLTHPTLSQNLTDALKDKFQAQTSLIIVNGEGDVDFEGEITNYNIRPTNITAEERAAQNRLTITVKVKYTNSVEPDLSFNKSFSRYEDVSSDLTLSDVDEETIEGIIDEIVQDIFNEAFVNW